MGDCVNFMNQEAIDEIIRKHNADFGEQLYQEGRNCCVECRDSPFPVKLPESPEMQFLQMATNGQVHRICFKPR